MNTIIQGRCEDYFSKFPDKSVPLIITDPPYGIGADKMQMQRAGKAGKSSFSKSKDYGESDWDSQPITHKHFLEFQRVSKNQVICGAEYICDWLTPKTQWIFWDKLTGSNTYADGELIWTSFDGALRKFEYMWKGMFQGDMKDKEFRIHPTQKPLPLMEWLIEKYSKPDDLIVDFFAGSGTTCVAAKKLGRNFIGIELDQKYVDIANRRLKQQLYTGRDSKLAQRGIIRRGFF